MSDLKLNHVLQSGYFNKTLREWQSMNTNITASSLMLPIFVHENDDCDQEIPSLPEVRRLGINKLEGFLRPLVENNLKSILLFGVIENESVKDVHGSFADHPNNPVTRAIPLIRNIFPELTIACDVCLCAYTNHGHCGVFNQTSVDSCNIDLTQVLDRETSVKRIASMALAFAKAGADVVAPSDMMDGRIHEIKKVLNENKLLNRVCVMSYSTKFSSAFYGPFRDAAKSAPSFGNRKCYQLPCNSTGLGRK